ncbi:MAG: hypothetical protein ACON5H_06955 [Akkermansiaceae bacterium]
MSLRGFHLIFITLASIACAAIGVWALFLEANSSQGLQIFGAVFLISAVALLFYARSFYRKAKNLST